MHRKWHSCVGPIDGAGRSENQVPHLSLATPFQDVEKTREVAVYIGMRVSEGISHTSLGCEMDHDVKIIAPEKRLYPSTISKI